MTAENEVVPFDKNIPPIILRNGLYEFMMPSGNNELVCVDNEGIVTPLKPDLVDVTDFWLTVAEYLKQLDLEDKVYQNRMALLKTTFNVYTKVLSGRETLLDNPRFARQHVETYPEVPRVRGLGQTPSAVFIDEPHSLYGTGCEWVESGDVQKWLQHRSTCRRDLLPCLAGEAPRPAIREIANGTGSSSRIW